MVRESLVGDSGQAYVIRRELVLESTLQSTI
jgi:hypothetical protein